MSGIITFTKQSITIVGITACILSFSAISAAEKTVKASVAKKYNTTIDELVSVSSNSNNSQKSSMVEQSSQLSTERRSSYTDVSDPGLMIEQNNGSKDFISSNAQAKSNIRSGTLSNSSNTVLIVSHCA